MYWEPNIETLPRPQLEELQLARLQTCLSYAQRSSFYRQRFAQAGFDPTSMRNLNDLQRIPFTTKQDLRDEFPTGLLCVDKQETVRIHSSSGTTGQIIVVFYNQHDIDSWTNLMSRCMYAAGVRKNHVFQNMVGYGLFTGGLGFHFGAENLGALTIPSAAGNSRRQVFLMQTMQTTTIHIIPSYALAMMNVLSEMGVDPKTDLFLKRAFLGAEPYSEATRKRVEAHYGIDVFNSYGLTEMNGPGVAFECTVKDGMHLWEDAFIMEVIDPVTLEPLPDGQEGELVFTTIDRQAMPILRYRTKDLASVYTEPCPCGRTHRRVSRIKGRIDDMIILKGVNIFPVQIETTLMKEAELGSNYLIVLERRNNIDDMTVKVEVRPDFFTGDPRQLGELRQRLVNNLRTEILITPKVELLEPNSLPVAEGKAVRVQDLREL